MKSIEEMSVEEVDAESRRLFDRMDELYGLADRAKEAVRIFEASGESMAANEARDEAMRLSREASDCSRDAQYMRRKVGLSPYLSVQVGRPKRFSEMWEDLAERYAAPCKKGQTTKQTG